MFWIGISLMIIGLIMGAISIYKAAHYTISPICAGWLCYGGIFVVLLGAVFIN